MLFPLDEEDGLSQANETWTEGIHWTVGSHPAAASGQAEVKVPTPTPNHCAMAHQGEPHSKHLVTFETTNSWVNVIWRFIGQPYYPCLLFLPCHETPWWLPAQTGKNTSSSIIREHITKHIVQLTDHLLLVDMSRTVASSLIISRSFQTKPFFQKVNLTPGLRYEVITMDDGQLKIPLKWKSTVVSFWPLCLTF